MKHLNQFISIDNILNQNKFDYNCLILVIFLQQSKIFHIISNTYSQHLILDNFYDDFTSYLDELIEVLIGNNILTQENYNKHMKSINNFISFENLFNFNKNMLESDILFSFQLLLYVLNFLNQQLKRDYNNVGLESVIGNIHILVSRTYYKLQNLK